MVGPAKAPSTEGVANFNPEELVSKWATGEFAPPQDNDLHHSITKTFGLRAKDQYVYHALVSVTLSQVQHAVSYGGQHDLHAWYRDEAGNTLPPPAITDVDAYTSIFSSTTSTTKALTAFSKNAKKASIRDTVADHLISNRLFPSTITVPKLKTAHVNPYLNYWAWSCRNLEWVGPNAQTANTTQSHHILPVFYHHFGCVCPSFEALESIRILAKRRAVVELGSGNGYWTFMLRRMGVTVHAVDNGDSLWRTTWIGDTIRMDGAQYLAKENGAKDAVLLLVYPQVTTDFTTSVLKAYAGSTICVAGTQNTNGYTAFKDVVIDKYLAVELPAFEKIVQTPLPSFAGKDEALFVFEKKSVDTTMIVNK